MDIKSLPWYGQLLVFILIGFVFIGIYYKMYYSDGQIEITNLETQKSQLESDIQKLQMKKREIAKIRKDIEIKEANLEKLKEILPNKKEIDKILRVIQGRIKDCNLTILNFTPKGLMPKNITIKQRVTVKNGDRERVEMRNVTIKNVYAEWPISLSIRGRYHDLAVFFVHLCSLSRIFTIDNFKISAYNKQSRDITISANVEAKTYIFIEKENKNTGPRKVLNRRG
jgi:type IV pilus assembly protein PilO